MISGLISFDSSAGSRGRQALLTNLVIRVVSDILDQAVEMMSVKE
jgi:hypothetical protein